MDRYAPNSHNNRSLDPPFQAGNARRSRQRDVALTEDDIRGTGVRCNGVVLHLYDERRSTRSRERDEGSGGRWARTVPVLERGRLHAVDSQRSTRSKTATLLDDEASIDDAVETLLEKDDDASLRQVHGVDTWGNTSTFSGAECVDWFGSQPGSVAADAYTVAGNMLEGEHVIEAVATEFRETADSSQSFVARPLTALQAGEDAGGDTRAGKAQSAAVTVYDPDEPRLSHDLRVDDHGDPVAELRRVYEVAREDDEHWAEEFPEAVLRRTL